MKALHLSENEITYREEYRSNPPASSMVRVKVLQAGICETDLQLKRGYMQFEGVPGHEFVGVAESGPHLGKRVVGEINCACEQCDLCRRGRPRHCPNRTVIGILNHDGAFAENVWVPQRNLHVVPDDVPTERAVFTEPVAAACRILEQISLGTSDRVVIFGDGRLGNLCAQVLRTTGCSLIVVGKHDWKLQQLASLSIETTLLDDFQPTADADIVVDCTGSSSGLTWALPTVKPCGTVVLKTTVAEDQTIHMSPIVIDEVRVLGSRCGPFMPALSMIADGRVCVDSLVSARYPLSQGAEALRHAERPDALKILLDVAE